MSFDVVQENLLFYGLFVPFLFVMAPLIIVGMFAIVLYEDMTGRLGI